jgi:hypothetical protein
MNRIALVSGTVLLGAMFIAGQNNEWKYISATRRIKVYYNPAKIKDKGNKIRQAWIKEVPSSERERKAFIAEKKSTKANFDDYAYTLTLEEHDCSNQRSRPRQIVYYDSNNEVIDLVDFTEPPNWADVIPDSIGEETNTAICKEVVR